MTVFKTITKFGVFCSDFHETQVVDYGLVYVLPVTTQELKNLTDSGLDLQVVYRGIEKNLRELPLGRSTIPFIEDVTSMPQLVDKVNDYTLSKQPMIPKSGLNPLTAFQRGSSLRLTASGNETITLYGHRFPAISSGKGYYHFSGAPIVTTLLNLLHVNERVTESLPMHDLKASIVKDVRAILAECVKRKLIYTFEVLNTTVGGLAFNCVIWLHNHRDACLLVEMCSQESVFTMRTLNELFLNPSDGE